MSRNAIFQRLILDLWDGIRGVSVSLSRDATTCELGWPAWAGRTNLLVPIQTAPRAWSTTKFLFRPPKRNVAPRLTETGTPRIPAQRSRRSLWNTTLLDIEQISSYYKNKSKGLMLQRITSARRHYACDTTLALC